MMNLKVFTVLSTLALSLTSQAMTISCTGLDGYDDKFIEVSRNSGPSAKVGVNGGRDIFISEFGQHRVLVMLIERNGPASTLMMDMVTGFSLRTPGAATLDCVRID